MTETNNIVAQSGRPTVIDKVVNILKAFRPGEASLSLGELAARTSLPKSSVHRFASVLVRHNLLVNHGQGHYSLGMGLWELGSRAVEVRLALTEIEPYARQIAEHCGETCHVGVLDGGEVVYVIRIAGSQSVGVQTRLGQRVPAHCTATGKAILAWQKPEDAVHLLKQPLTRFTANTPATTDELLKELSATRKHGYSVNFGAWQADLCGTAAPILDRFGIAVASIGVAGPAYRITEERMHELGQYVRRIAAEISERFSRGVRRVS